MKKLFGGSDKKARDWEEYNENEYDWDSEEEAPENEEIAEEDYYYEEEEIEDGGEWPEEEEAYYEEEMYANPSEEFAYGEDSYAEAQEEGYADIEGEEYTEDWEEDPYYMAGEEDEEPQEEEAYMMQEDELQEDGYAQEGYGMEEPLWEEEQLYEEDSYEERAVAAPLQNRGDRKKAQPKVGFFAKLGRTLRSMDAMDRIMVGTGVGVLILAIVTGCVFISAKSMDRQVADFVDVGTQIDGISMIGEEGLLAVADAQRAKLAASAIVDTDTEPEEPKKEYEESGYERQVSVLPSFTSIQKDLKIKFINKKTDKLVPNVPFSVTITDPNGKTGIWSDDDMDGIIYKKDITPGTYKVAMEALTDEKYAGYTLSMDTQTVEVKKEIDYKKVDVTNEVKQESEVDTKAEDTKKNEVVVESSLQDTVAWVESKVVGTTYEQVDKSTIQDPMTLAVGKRFLRMSGTDAQTETSTEPTTEPTGTPTEEPTGTPPPTETPTPPADTTTPPIDPTDTPTPPSSTPEPTPEPTPTPTPTPTPEPTLAPVTVSVNQTALTGTIGGKMAAIATAAGTKEGGDIEYIISSNNAAVATAVIDASGNITIEGKAAGTANLTITANYKSNGKPETAGTAVITVTIKGNISIRLDKNAITVFTKNTANITATLVEAVPNALVTAASSDAGKATVTVQNNVITVTGVSEGSATITISYTEGTQTVTATCAVTVKKSPKEDTATLLKDKNGQQVFVKEKENYREATYADYYTASAFYLRGEAKYTGWQTIDGKVYYFTADGKKVTGEQVIQGAKYNFASDGSMVVGNGTVGIDVSKWNGKIDWTAVKNSGISYVIIRCGYRGSSEGKLIADSRFTENIQGANAAGLKVGIYFYSQAIDEIEAVEEASMVLGQIKNYKISYPVFLDVESSGGRGDKIDKTTRTAVCKAFCQTIQNAGYTAGVYSNKYWLETRIDASALSAYKIWMAQYAAAPTYKSRYDLWQYRSTGSVNGISGNVDMNISYLGY